jgi:predicted metal-dependent phosphoesterase TrpH
MLIDLHCHSKYSNDNHLEPRDLISRALDLGLDGVCFTEHHSMEASKPVLRVELPPDFVVLRGVEVSTDCGHLLVYGVTDDSWNRWGRHNHLNLSQVIQRVHNLGGICVPAHPFRGWDSLGEKIYSFPHLDAVETHNGVNGSQQNDRAIQAAMKLGLPGVGGSDCHTIKQVGRAVTELRNPIQGMEDLLREIKAGNSRGLMGPDLLRSG